MFYIFFFVVQGGLGSYFVWALGSRGGGLGCGTDSGSGLEALQVAVGFLGYSGCWDESRVSWELGKVMGLELG